MDLGWLGSRVVSTDMMSILEGRKVFRSFC